MLREETPDCTGLQHTLPDQLVLRYKDILDNISEISTLNFFGETAGCITPFYKKNLFSIRQVIQLEYRCSYNLPNRAKTAKLTLRKVLQL